MSLLLKALLNISDNVVLLTVPFEEYNAGQTVCHNISLLFNVDNLDVELLELCCLMPVYAVT